MKKTLITIIIGFIAIIGGVFAHDCGMVAGNGLEDSVDAYATYGEYHTVIPEAAFNRALINLKAYCCSQKIITCADAEKVNLPKEKYPESSYLFDHLLDVTMRRLDGVASLAYDLEPDKAGKDRRAYITQVAKNPIGEQAMTLETTYKEYRTLRVALALDVVEKNFANANNGATLSLGDKYATVCKFMKNIYENIQDNKTIIGWWYESNSFFRNCKNTVDNRVYRETSYVKLLMIKKSSQLLDESTKAYTKKYFVEEKLMGLRNLVAKVQDMFTTIVQQAPASKTCSK